MKSKLIPTTLLLLLTIQIAYTQNYYATALGLNGSTLKTSLHNIIKNHIAQPWPLWNYFPASDSKPNGEVWDIYSDNPGGSVPYSYSFGTDQCGTYSSEGDCFNHEHTWPSTYFNDASPMRTDLHHVLPTDGYVNNKRSNWPFGEVNSTTWNGQNGSKLGNTNSYTGYTDKAFEPIDSFKGDLARVYFYMSTRYEGEDAGWKNWQMANGASLTNDAINLLLQWHHNDPVSQKEKNRNDAIYAIQGNRNPFIDYPIFADCIWGSTDCTPLNLIERNVLTKITISPNPAKDIIELALPKNILLKKLEIFNMQGQKLIESTTSPCAVQNLKKGLYILNTYFDNTSSKLLFLKD